MSSYLYVFRNFIFCKSLSSFFDHRLTFAGRLALCLTFSLANIGLVAHWTQATLFQDTLVDFEIVGLIAGGLSALVFPVLYVLDHKTRLCVLKPNQSKLLSLIVSAIRKNAGITMIAVELSVLRE